MENNSYVVDGTSSWVLAPTGELTNYGILSIVYDHSNSEFFVNSVSKGGSSNTINPIFNTVGSRTNGSLFLSGDIAEIILFDSVLVDTNRQKIENYLFLKYAWPKVDLGPDINDSYSLCPVILDAGNRFSNFLWSTGDTTQTITTQSSGTFSVTVTNGFGFQSSDTVNVSLKTFNMADTAFCLGSYVTLSSKLNHKYRFLWSDLSTDSILTTNVAGKYWLRVSDSLGLCSVADTFNVVADSFAVKVSLGPNRNICSGEYLGLVSGASEAIIYFWSNGSGNSIIVVPDPVGSQPTYSVIVTDINSCIGMDTITLNVTGVKPIVNFSFDSVCFGSPTHFTDASSVASGDVINGRKWMFYDNDSSTLTNPSHIFSHDGVFNVSLNVTTVLGCNTSLIKPITVFSIPTPEFSPGMGCHLAPTKFFDASHSAYGNIEEWHWEFDDPASGGNDTSFQQNPIHNFDLPGTYNVLQRVRTIVGCTDSIRKTVVIKSTPNADYLATTTCVGKETYFADQTFVLPQDEIMEWHWKFGDGDSSATKNPAHLYTSAGSFTAVMKIKSLNGCWAAMTKNVKIHAMPDAAFATLGSCLTFGTQFTDNTTILDDTITQWRWGFGNGDASNLQNPLYIYPDTGAYNVTLNVITNAGCADSVRQTIQVHSLPKAEFTFNPEYGDSPLDVDFYNQSIRGTSYLWDFGDGTAPSLDQNPTHVYTADGIYKILLTTYNQFNCPDTTSYYVYVIPSYSDIMVKSVTAEIKDNKLTIKAELKNVGSRRLRHLELAAHVSNENSIIENWDGILSPGQTMTYEFSAKFYVSSQQTIDFVCVLANVLDDNTEFNKSDNEACAVLTEEFSVQNPYPNPTKDQINITYIVPFEDNVEIKLYDSKGELVYTIFSGTAVQGFNRIVLDVSLLAQGVYAYKVVFRDKVQANRFVKN
jgi:PKD repeat protein